MRYVEGETLANRIASTTSDGDVSLVVDLDAPDAARLPEAASLEIELSGVKLPRIPVGKGFSGLPLVIAALTTGLAEVS